MNPKEILNKYYHFAGYDVYGVSPIYDKIEDDIIYSSLEAIEAPIDVVVFVIKKEYAISYIDEMTALGIHYAWMQPNTYDDELLAYIKNVGITPITACILIESQ